MKLDQVHAIVTGGASGMGRATVEALVANGGKVCIVDYNKEWGEEVAAASNGAAYFEFADVSDPKRAEEIVANAVEKMGYVNVVVNCAGVGSATRILPRGGGVHPYETFMRVLNINLVGTFNYTCYGALAMSNAPANEDGERGVIVNCTSVSVTGGQIGQAAYVASKGGVDAMTLPIARELGRIGVRVNTIAPGVVATNITSVEAENKPKVPHPAPDPNAPNPLAAHLIFPKRTGHASEFASLVLEMIRNSLINGAAYNLDGAIRLTPKW